MTNLNLIRKQLAFCFLVLISSTVQSQNRRICRNKNDCIFFPDQLGITESIPIWAPVPTYNPPSNLNNNHNINNNNNNNYAPQYPQYSQQSELNQNQNSRPPQNVVHSPVYNNNFGFSQPQPAVSSNTQANYNNPLAQNISSSILNMAQELSRHFQSTSLKGEQIFSPISIFSVLQLLLTGANGKTYNELNRFLSYSSNMGAPAYQSEFGKMIEDLISDAMSLKRQRPEAEWKFTGKDIQNLDLREPKLATPDDRKTKIRFANGLFIQNGYTLRPSYQEVVQNLYQSEIQQLDFKQPNIAEAYINNWVNEKTFGKISNIVNRGSIQDDTSIIMACALYFKAFWEKPFISGGTVVNDFYPDGLTNTATAIKVNMMANGGVFPYYEDAVYKIKVIGFPYLEGKSTMYIFQPFESNKESMRQMQNILNPEMIEFMIANMIRKTAVFAFPRLHVTNEINLKSTLYRLGLQSIFRIDESNLSLIPESNSETALNQINRPQPQHMGLNQIARPPSRRPDIIFLNRFGDTSPNIKNQMENQTDTSETTEKILEGIETGTTPNDTETKNRRRRSVTYKVESEYKQPPLRFKDFLINKRITKLTKGKKLSRSRRDVSDASLEYLQSLRQNTHLIKPNLFVDDIIHKVDLVVNEEGTEGAAATITYLRRSGTDVVFRADTPFLMLIRHDATKIPLFYGPIFEPKFN